MPPASSPAASLLHVDIDGIDDHADDAADALSLPPAWTPPARPPIPIVAATVPIVGAVVLWLVTGSMLALWLAALGPLIAVATVLDAGRSARGERRRAAAAAGAARDAVSAAIDRRHEAERRQRWARHPDVASFLDRDGEIWRAVAGRGDALVVGAGDVTSALRVSGGDSDREAVILRRRAARLPGAPVVVTATDGVVVTGAAMLAAAVVRGLVLQLCLALPPGDLRIVGPLRGEHAWAERLPHRRATSGLRLAIVPAGDPVPADADIAVAERAPGEPPPPQCAVLVTVDAPGRARVDHGGGAADVRVEALGRAQAEAVAGELAARAERSLGMQLRPALPVAFADMVAAAPAPRAGTLEAVLGLDGGDPAVIDLVADGPHAVVAGVTGSGKSELLITWILALCATHSTREVSFLLADFKGGTAFDALSGVPHVTGVITDLDGAGARRAIESLRAELRWREAEIAGAGARDILDPRVDLPRLVVVVDEFAALLGDHPELHAVFSDVAARGRALGVHLIVGTQRASGVIRESLLANCPLRVSLRVTDAADSRVVVGTDAAALLPGGAEGRGLALIRRGSAPPPRRVRVALTGRSDVDAVVERAEGGAPRRPWLPPLPSHLSLADLTALPAAAEPGLLVLGLADEPERQRQRPVGVRVADRGLLVVGGPGSGKSSVLAAVAAQAPGAVVRVPVSGEGAWDAVATLTEQPPPPGAVVVIDDLDTLAARLPHDHAHELMERLERVLREAGERGILVAAAAQRLTGATARLVDLLPRRVILPTASRADHFAAGGDPARFSPDAPPGRGTFDGLAVQVAIAPRLSALRPADPAPWLPDGRLSGFVARRSPAARGALAAWEARGIRIAALDEYAADPSISAAGPLVLTGEPDDWQRHWRVLAEIRADHAFVVDASCAAELRLLTGLRSLPPYCEPGRGRAWLMSAGADPVRIVLPGDEVRPLRANERS